MTRDSSSIAKARSMGVGEEPHRLVLHHKIQIQSDIVQPFFGPAHSQIVEV